MLRLVVVVLSAALALLIFSGPARADFGIAPGSFTATVQDDAGNDLTQAGAHPNGTTSFELNTTTNPVGGEVPDQTLKDVQVDLPAGLIGNPQATPQCAPADFNNNTCAPATQVGTVTLDLAAFAGGAHFTLTDPVYNLKPAADQVAQFGFFIEGKAFLSWFWRLQGPTATLG